MRHPLIVLIPHFGRWPEWIELFVESCKWNPGVRWRLYTDCGEPENRADNVEYVHLGFDDYKRLVRERLDLEFDPQDPYKLCDLRPALGEIHRREIEDFEFFGFGDLDVIYGDLRHFYSDELLRRFDLLSTHADRLSGHFAVLRNTPELRRAFRRYPRYRADLAAPEYLGMDESLASIWRPAAPGGGPRRFVRRLLSRLKARPPRLALQERYSTVLSDRGWHDGTMRYPARWIWRQGRLTNDRDGDRQFMYLHFMRWKSLRWAPAEPAEGEGAWLDLERLVSCDWRQAAEAGFCISREGFTALPAVSAAQGAMASFAPAE